MNQILKHFLDNNRRWSETKLHEDPAYFDQLSAGQMPSVLLIGCSDSRVSPAVVLGSDLGEVFVHRNIANVVAHADLNFLSVLQYAVEVLGIRDIIVYGHYGCGGIKAAMEDQVVGLIGNWLAHIKDVIVRHKSELDIIKDERVRLDRLVELNVLAQLENLKQTSIYRKAEQNKIELSLHAWVYDFSTGLINVLPTDDNIPE